MRFRQKLPMRRAANLLFTLVAVFACGQASAAPNAELWEQWAAHSPDSNRQIDHSIWDRWLGKHVSQHKDGINRVAYHKVKKPERRLLDNYIEQLSATRISSHNRAEQRAYWINLYNALTVREILDHHPVASIKDIKSNIITAGPWKKPLAVVEGVELSLDDIEHRILRPIWQDPRIHYAVNCASIGCPNIMRAAFTAKNTEALMNSATKDFINHPRAVTVTGDKLRVSSIYVWFKEDFGGSDEGVITHLKQYAKATLRGRLNSVTRIDGDVYDWSLNSSETSKPSNNHRRGS